MHTKHNEDSQNQAEPLQCSDRFSIHRFLLFALLERLKGDGPLGPDRRKSVEAAAARPKAGQHAFTNFEKLLYCTKAMSASESGSPVKSPGSIVLSW